MNEMQVFNNSEFGEIRTVIIDNEPWFVGKDVADILKYQNGSRDINRHVDEDDRQNYQNGIFDSPRGMTIINESGLYSLIFGSKLETAKKFKKWVTSEVLPSIRKTGSYNTPPMTIPEQIQLLAKGNVEIHKRMDDMQSEITSIKLDLPILPIEADKITSAVRKKGVEILGGKDSAAYNDRGLRQLLYNSIYANVKYNFNIKSYKSLKRCECDKAIEIINEYQPPFFLQQRINTENLQQKFDISC